MSKQANTRQKEKKREREEEEREKMEVEVILHHRLDSALLVVVNRKWGQQQEME